jgi:hypothetical protein
MNTTYLSRILGYGGSAVLAGAAIYLAKDNRIIKEKYEKSRLELIKMKKDVAILIGGFKEMHKKYLSLADDLKAHVEGLIDDLDLMNWIDHPEVLTERFAESDLQFFSPDMIMTKITGLTDAFILNKWSYFPNKSIPKSFLSNGKSLDIYNRNDVELVLGKMKIARHIQSCDRDFIMDLFNYFKEPVLINGKIPEEYDNLEIEYYFDYAVNMILERS